MVYQVGSPAMFDGKRFFPLTGTPIPKMLFSSTLLADCEPDPFTVATLMLKSFVTRSRATNVPCSCPRARFPVAIWRVPSGKFWKDSVIPGLSCTHVIIVTLFDQRLSMGTRG